MNIETVMQILDEEYKEQKSGAYEFCWSELAESAGITQREAIDAVNHLAADGRLLFVAAIVSYGNGDYLVRYE